MLRTWGSCLTLLGYLTVPSGAQPVSPEAPPTPAPLSAPAAPLSAPAASGACAVPCAPAAGPAPAADTAPGAPPPEPQAGPSVSPGPRTQPRPGTPPTPSDVPTPTASPSPEAPPETPAPTPDYPRPYPRPDFSGAVRAYSVPRQPPGFYFGGMVQTQYDSAGLGSNTIRAVRPHTNGLGGFTAEDALALRRTRVSTLLRVTDDLDLFSMVQYDSPTNSITLFDLNLRYRFEPGTYLTVGQLKTRWGWEGLRLAWNTNTIERSDATRFLYPGRDLGLNFDLQKGPVQFSVGGFSLQGQNRNPQGGGGVVARLAYDITDNFVVGLSAAQGTSYDGTSRIPFSRQNVEVRVYVPPLTLEAEQMWSNGFNALTNGQARSSGGYAALVYRVDDAWDALINYDWFDPDLDERSLTTPSNALNGRNRWVLGVNYYLDRETYHRFMLNLEQQRSTEGPPVNNTGVRLRYQFRF